MSLHIVCAEFVEFVAKSVAVILDIHSLEDIRIVKSIVLHAVLSELNSHRNNVPMVGGKRPVTESARSASNRPFDNGVYPLEVAHIAASTAEVLMTSELGPSLQAPTATPAPPIQAPVLPREQRRGTDLPAVTEAEDALAMATTNASDAAWNRRGLAVKRVGVQVAELHKASSSLYEAFKRGDNLSVAENFITFAEKLNRVDTPEKASLFMNLKDSFAKATIVLGPLSAAVSETAEILRGKNLESNANAYRAIQFKNEKANLQVLKELYKKRVVHKNEVASSAVWNYGKAAAGLVVLPTLGAASATIGLPFATAATVVSGVVGAVSVTRGLQQKYLPKFNEYLNPIIEYPGQILEQASTAVRSGIRAHVPLGIRAKAVQVGQKAVNLGKGAHSRLGLATLNSNAEDQLINRIYQEMKELEERKLFEDIEPAGLLPSRKHMRARASMAQAPSDFLNPFHNEEQERQEYLKREREYNLQSYAKKETKRIDTLLNRPIIADALYKTNYIPDRSALELTISKRVQATIYYREVWKRLKERTDNHPKGWPNEVWRKADPKNTMDQLEEALKIIKQQITSDKRLHEQEGYILYGISSPSSPADLEKTLSLAVITYHNGAFIEEGDADKLRKVFFDYFHYKRRRIYFPDTFLHGLKDISLTCTDDDDCTSRVEKFFEDNEPPARRRAMDKIFETGVYPPNAWAWPYEDYIELKTAVLEEAVAKRANKESSAIETKWNELIEKEGEDSWDNERFNEYNNVSVNSNDESVHDNSNNESVNGNNMANKPISTHLPNNIRERRLRALTAPVPRPDASAPVPRPNAPVAKNANNEKNKSRKANRERRLAAMNRRTLRAVPEESENQDGGYNEEKDSTAAQKLSTAISAIVYNSLKNVGYTTRVAKTSTLAVYTYLKVMEILFSKVGIKLQANNIQYTTKNNRGVKLLNNSTRKYNNSVNRTRKALTVGGATNAISSALNAAIEGKTNIEIRNAVYKISGTQKKGAIEIADNFSYIFDKLT